MIRTTSFSWRRKTISGLIELSNTIILLYQVACNWKSRCLVHISTVKHVQMLPQRPGKIHCENLYNWRWQVRERMKPGRTLRWASFLETVNSGSVTGALVFLECDGRHGFQVGIEVSRKNWACGYAYSVHHTVFCTITRTVIATTLYCIHWIYHPR